MTEPEVVLTITYNAPGSTPNMNPAPNVKKTLGNTKTTNNMLTRIKTGDARMP